MKTTLNPSMKPTEFSMTLRSSCASCDLSSSTPAPEISDTYPGTSGSTQGERNDTNPATKAAIGSGSVDIQKYCTCLLQCSRTSPGQKVRCLWQQIRARKLPTIEKMPNIREG